jgi:hypothetical protein
VLIAVVSAVVTATEYVLNKDFAALCNVHVPCGDFLFGDLSKATKDITDANKLSKKVSDDINHISAAEIFFSRRVAFPRPERGGTRASSV